MKPAKDLDILVESSAELEAYIFHERQRRFVLDRDFHGDFLETEVLPRVVENVVSDELFDDFLSLQIVWPAISRVEPGDAFCAPARNDRCE